MILSKKHDHIDIDIEALASVIQEIERNWTILEKSNTHNKGTLIGLPHPYIVPALENGQFTFEEQYYWDSYFISLGLDTHQKLSEGMLDNLIYLLDQYGVIPNANRMYFLSRSQPPVLTSYIFHIYETFKKSDTWLERKIQKAEQEYHSVWMSETHPHWRHVHQGLSRYYDINSLHDLAEAESGWDMTTRFKRKCLDYLPVDLNSLLYRYEMDFSRTYSILGKRKVAKDWADIAQWRKKTMSALMWSDSRKFFFDYNYQTEKCSPVYSLAAYYTMWSGLATPTQARILRDKLGKFETTNGLSTTSAKKTDLSVFGSLDAQWAYPNGWAPLHYIVIAGLERYGYHDDAKRIARKWLRTNIEWYKRHGELQEKYNVVHAQKPPKRGLYPNQSGFGWTNGVFLYLAKKYL